MSRLSISWAFSILSFLSLFSPTFSLTAATRTDPHYVALYDFADNLTSEFRTSFAKDCRIVWLRVSDSLFMAGFAENEFYVFEQDLFLRLGFSVRETMDWTAELRLSVFKGAMPRGIWETVSPVEKENLRKLFADAKESGRVLDTLDGPSRAFDEMGFSIVGQKNSAAFIHQLYSTGIVAGILGLFIVKPWSMTSFPQTAILLMATTSVPLAAFFVIGAKFPRCFTDDRWNPVGRYSPAVIGFGLTVMPSLCHALLRLIP